MPDPAAPPEPATIAEDLARLIRLGGAMQAETARIEAEQAAFWRACRARAAPSRAAPSRAAAP